MPLDRSFLRRGAQPAATVSRRAFLGSAIGVSGIAALSLAGCSTSTTGSAGSGAITIMSLANEISPDVVKAWNTAHRSSPLSLINFDQTRLNSMIAAGSPPDLVRMPGAAQSTYYAARGISADITSMLSKSSLLKPAGLAKANDVWRWDGSKQGSGAYFGLVKDWSQDLMYWYDADVLAAAGISAPTDEKPLTYEQLLEHARPMTKRAGGKVTQYGLFGTTPTSAWIGGMVATAGGSLYSDDLKKIDFTSPEAQRALQWFVDVAKAKVGYTLVDVNPDGWDWPPFSTKRQALDQAGYWLTGLVSPDKTVGSTAKLAPAPLLGSTRVSPTTAATGYWISAKSSRKDEAFGFLEWYCGGTEGIARAKAGGGLPCVDALTKHLPQSTAAQKSALKTQKNEEQYLSVVTTTPYIDSTGIDASLAKHFASAVSGSLSVGQYGDAVTSEVNALLATGVKTSGI